MLRFVPVRLVSRRVGGCWWRLGLVMQGRFVPPPRQHTPLRVNNLTVRGVTGASQSRLAEQSPARRAHLCWVRGDAPRMESAERRSPCATGLCLRPLKARLTAFLPGSNSIFVSHKHALRLVWPAERRVRRSDSGHHRIWHASSILRGCFSGILEFNISVII